jgi:hypothetical protein
MDAMGDPLGWVLAALLLIAIVVFLGSSDRREPPTADQLIAEMKAEKVPVKDAQVTDLRCYCTPERQRQWKLGAQAGEDRIVGTGDDITLPEEKKL